MRSFPEFVSRIPDYNPMHKNPYIMIDDDVPILDILRQSLCMEGYTREAFTRSEDALAALERTPPHILITDIVMPGMGDSIWWAGPSASIPT
jgi:DNA-binding NtrC family response regulator